MNTRFLLSTLCIALLLISIGCKDNVSGPNEKGELPRELTTAEKKLITADQNFSFNVFKSTTSYDKSDNVFISPLSISMALGMTLNGAKRETHNQMQQVLSLTGMDQNEINEGYQSLITLLTEADPKVKMQIANSVWNRQEFTVQKEFKDVLKKHFDAQTTELDFNDPKSADTINKWVNDNTNGLIDKIINGQIPSDMVMYLINAIYFKGNWTHQFDKEDTRKQNFFLENDESVTVDMMHQKRNFNTYRSDEVHMIDLPYGDSLYSMTIMLPAESETSLEAFIDENFSYENFSAWIGNLTKHETMLSLPKFELEYETSLNEVLKSMGMKNAFEENNADFSGINPNAQLFISEVKHKTFLKVDEEGTEAAAVTSVGVAVTSAPPSITINRPFVFVIREQDSGTILFMGKVKNPAK